MSICYPACDLWYPFFLLVGMMVSGYSPFKSSLPHCVLLAGCVLFEPGKTSRALAKRAVMRWNLARNQLRSLVNIIAGLKDWVRVRLIALPCR
jgi:hypothetical protein